MALDENISIARNLIIDDMYGSFFMRLYPFTTERISGYMDYFKLEDGKLLTVGSSGDQVINAASRGCKDITLYDYNPLAKYYLYLKRAAILSLSLEEFEEFFKFGWIYVFKSQKYLPFKDELYQKIKPTLKVLDEESFEFWDTIFNTYDRYQVKMGLFKNDVYCAETVMFLNRYLLSPTFYEEAKEALKDVDITCMTGDIKDFSSDKRYDSIWLSNIYAYSKDVSAIKEYEAIFKDNLTEEGKILLGYFYRNSVFVDNKNYRGKYLTANEFAKANNLDFDIEVPIFKGVNYFIGKYGFSLEDCLGKNDSVIIGSKPKEYIRQ